MQRWMWQVIPVLAMAALRAHAACVPVDVRYDDRAQAVQATITLPPGMERVALRDLAPYQRRKLWTSPDGSARIDETSLAPAHAGQRTLHITMDVRTDAPIEDRAYPPYLRFADGTVGVYSPLFLAPEPEATTLCPRWLPSSGGQVIGYGKAQATALATDMAHPEGYVMFGRPDVTRRGAWMLVSDRAAPAWIRDRIAAQAPSLVERFHRTMGPARVPTLVLYARPTPPGARDYKGDHLPASITLGLFGDTWDTVDEATADQLTLFLAHELFHSWDSDALLGSPEGEALLAKEGGADLAKILATASLLGKSPQAVLDDIAQAYNACLFELPATAGVAAALARRDPGRMPYDCGVPLMYSLAVAADRHDPARGYFDLWRTLRDAHRNHPADGYRWQDLVPASITPAVRVALARAVAEPGAYPAAMRAAWSALGLHVQTETRLDAGTRRTWAAQIMAHLMAQDCDGSISFWNNPGGITLDSSLPHCRTLRPGAMVVSILGESLKQTDMPALANRVRALCVAHGEVDVGYAANAGRPAPATSRVRCTAPLPEWGMPVKLVAASR